MLEVLGDALPTALGLAISPIPIIATVLLLLTPRARSTSVAYLAGTVVGLTAVVTVFALVGGALPEPEPDASKPVLGIVQGVLGILAIVVAVSQWRKRPRDGAEPTMPRWMAGLGDLSVPAVLGMGVALSAVNPKNLILAANAGVTIGGSSLPVGQAIAVAAIVVLIGVSTVLVPVVANLIWSRALQGPLQRLQGELQRDNAIIMAVLMLVIGVQLIGKAIGHL